MTLRNSNGYTCQCSFGLVNRLPIEKTLKIIFPTHIFPDMDGTRWYIVSRNFQVIFLEFHYKRNEFIDFRNRTALKNKVFH